MCLTDFPSLVLCTSAEGCSSGQVEVRVAKGSDSPVPWMSIVLRRMGFGGLALFSFPCDSLGQEEWILYPASWTRSERIEVVKFGNLGGRAHAFAFNPENQAGRVGWVGDFVGVGAGTAGCGYPSLTSRRAKKGRRSSSLR